MKKVKVKVGESEFEVGIEELEENKLRVSIGGEEHVVGISEAESRSSPAELKTVKAPMPGTISQIQAKEGQSVAKGEALLVILAMKMENVINAPAPGKVKSILVKLNDTVEMDQALIIFE